MADQAPTLKERVAQVTLTLRLLKKSVSPDQALRDDHGLQQVPSAEGVLFTGQSPASPPSWAKFLADIAPDTISELRTQSCSAVLFVATSEGTDESLFAFSFGQGHHSLNDDIIERGFGLRVVLNSVARNKLRTLDSASLDANVMQRRTQSSRDTDLSDFNLDENRDLLRLASGTPTSVEFAAALSGKDALTVSTKTTALDLAKLCDQAMKAYRQTHYQKDFAFIDHIQPVTDRALLADLDSTAFAELKSIVAGKNSDLHLATPDILAPGSAVEIGYFGTGLRSGAKTPYSEIAIADYIAELGSGISQIVDMAELRASHEIRVVKNGAGDRSHKRKLYNCFVFETVRSGMTYVLFDGQWFLIDRDYFTEVERDYNAVLAPPFLATTSEKNERHLIEKLASTPNLLCMDQTKLAPRGAGNAAIEACDFLSATKQFIHLKDGHGSAPLSHLWNQALVAAEAMVRDQTFRGAMRRSVRAREKHYGKTGFVALLPSNSAKLRPSDYTIVLAVMRHPYAASKKVGLPFFSKVAMRGPIQRMTMLGFNVELHLIEKF